MPPESLTTHNKSLHIQKKRDYEFVYTSLRNAANLEFVLGYIFAASVYCKYGNFSEKRYKAYLHL